MVLTDKLWSPQRHFGIPVWGPFSLGQWSFDTDLFPRYWINFKKSWGVFNSILRQNNRKSTTQTWQKPPPDASSQNILSCKGATWIIESDSSEWIEPLILAINDTIPTSILIFPESLLPPPARCWTEMYLVATSYQGGGFGSVFRRTTANQGKDNPYTGMERC